MNAVNNKTFIFIWLFVLVMGLTTAAQLNKPYDLAVSCSSFDCSKMNVTILYPNSSNFINNQPMTNNIYYANYTITPLVNGEYTYFYSDGTNSSKDTFIVTTTGNELNTSQIVLYVFVGFILLFLFFLSLYGGINLPYQNQRNTDDEVIQINYKKYLKIFCWGLSYMFFLAIIFVTYNLIYAYSQWDNLAIFFSYIYRLFFVMALPVFIGIILLGTINIINDKKIESFIKKTGLPYGI